jgi:hypothetical protein
MGRPLLDIQVERKTLAATRLTPANYRPLVSALGESGHCGLIDVIVAWTPCRDTFGACFLAAQTPRDITANLRLWGARWLFRSSQVTGISTSNPENSCCALEAAKCSASRETRLRSLESMTGSRESIRTTSRSSRANLRLRDAGTKSMLRDSVPFGPMDPTVTS